ncbi:START-like domain [Plasmopara halstedii]|uniref:START-like domain n=1 Tax=Plasmopara halstedii TaxID=4781 RepID=A0A0P1ALD9_PLAHL|nr:START-like domain [Plasmopara halstedii]CEG42127.1 START-like domain [Plasmopara halstedii]|eukprot:XP_024578496.1 START-like domain [Plasmopara halstedii]
MPKPYFYSVPEHISLSKAQHRKFTELADAIVAETLQTNELFVADDRQLPNDQWKHVKSKEKMHVYRSRHASKAMRPRGPSQDEKQPSRPRFLSLSAVELHERETTGRPYGYNDETYMSLKEKISTNTHSSSSDGESFSLEDDCVLAKIKPSHIPLVVATGAIDGTIENVAFGMFSNTKNSWIICNSYVHNDVFDDRKVLATLQLPSVEDPFRSVTIKWATGSFGAFTTRRDFLYLESMGMAFDSDGEEIFYNLIHSIELDDLCPPTEHCNIIRAQISTCYIARQLNDHSVDMFCRGFVDPRGDMVESYGILMLAHTVSVCSGYVECSNLKKLDWLMRQSNLISPITGTECGVCHKPHKKRSLLHSPTGCTICRRLTCSKCSVQKKLTVDVTDGIVQKGFTFCLSCVMVAKKLSAWEVAAAAVRSKESVS